MPENVCIHLQWGKIDYIAHYPHLGYATEFLKIVKLKPNTDNLRGVYCYIVFYQQHRIFCYIVVLLGDNILWGIKRSTTVPPASASVSACKKTLTLPITHELL